MSAPLNFYRFFLEEFVKFHILFLFAFIALFGVFSSVSAQVDSVIGQITSSPSAETFAGGISGDGRLIVFESSGDVATEKTETRNNADGNREIFLFDYAQRRIFQITNTKSLLNNIANAPTFNNVKVDIVNARPVLSNDGRWIAFSSNATCAFPGDTTTNPPLPPIVSATNPGSFDANTTGTAFACNIPGPNMTTINNLVNDGNTEIWLYQIPMVTPVNLSLGDELPVTNLSEGTFTRVTNTPPSNVPLPGSDTQFPAISDDNHDATINDNGSHIAFGSNRDLVPLVGNPYPLEDNPEIFFYTRATSTISQITKTPRGTISAPIKNRNPTISTLPTGNLRVVFESNADNPINLMTGGTNSDRNAEVFYADLTAVGALTDTKKQVTSTVRTNPGDVLNILNFGRRMSRDGRYIAFDSFVDLENASPTNQTSFALYLYDTQTPVTTPPTNPFRRIGLRSNADSGAAGGDVFHYPGFTDTNATGAPNTLVLETRMNIRADGTIPTNNDDGLNPLSARPPQVYSYPLNVLPTAAIFTRLTKFPASIGLIPTIQALPSNTYRRLAFNMALIEPGTGNFDLLSEVFYLLTPTANAQTPASISYATGASRIPISASPVPTPSPTATPTPTPTPSPSPSPTGSPSPTPTPVTPPAVQGTSPGSLTLLDFQTGTNFPIIVLRESVGSIDRAPTLPIELSGVTMTINGAACGLKRVSQRQIVFTVPMGLSIDATTNNSVYDVVINNNGTQIKGKITIVPSRPDIFTKLPTPGPGGRAKIFNATNAPFLNGEPFTVTTIRRRGGRRVPTVLRVHLTGVQNLLNTNFSIKIGSQPAITGSQAIISNAILVAPGEFRIDFLLPPGLNNAGDVPIIISTMVNGVTYVSRLDDTAPRLLIF